MSLLYHIFMLKFNNKNIRKQCEIRSKLITKNTRATSFDVCQRQLLYLLLTLNVISYSCVFIDIDDIEYINTGCVRSSFDDDTEHYDTFF